MNKDIFGIALTDAYKDKLKGTVWLHNNYDEPEEMPMDVFFRTPEDFPDLEMIALSLCDGKILDIGAGAGCHALYLQELAQDVTALELSAPACEIMRKRGVKQIVQTDIFNYSDDTFDTLLFLMNGIGLAGHIEGLMLLLERCKTLLNPGGQLLFDSSDISYLYEDGTINKPKGYYGEVRFQYEYMNEKGPLFDWLYIDQETLIRIGQQHGWVVQILHEDNNDQYLVRMELRQTT